MNRYLRQTREAVRATTIRPWTSFSWFGERSRILPARIRRGLEPENCRDYLLQTLQGQLYRDFYCQGAAGPRVRRATANPQERANFVARLRRANAGSGGWQPGWRVLGFAEDRIAVGRGGARYLAGPEECAAEDDARIENGSLVSVRFPNELLKFSPGFYMALSDRPFVGEDWQRIVRLYWNLTAEGAVAFLRLVSRRLNALDRPFKVKVLNDPAAFSRCDAVVLYFGSADYGTFRPELESIYAAVTHHLKRGVPAFTKWLAPGLGLAEDPELHESFGMHRCRLLAEGITTGRQERRRTLDERVAAVQERFARAGLDLERPYREPGPVRPYGFRTVPPAGAAPVSARDGGEGRTGERYLDAAQEIGRGLTQSAIWDGGRCSWVGAEPARGQDGVRVLFRSLGADLYGGTSGVALFLAELHAATGSVSCQRTAVAAMRQSLARADQLPPTGRVGFYIGPVGVAFAATRVGRLLGNEPLVQAASRLLGPLRDHDAGPHELDLLYGNAGAIPALLILSDWLDQPRLVDLAAELGDQLLSAATRRAEGYSWSSPDDPGGQHLTGLSHGTAGIAYALLELAEATGLLRYRHAAERALDFEHHWFQPAEGNWPDFRDEPPRGPRSRRPFSFTAYWCHGAAGIALSRLRFYEKTREKRYHQEAVSALIATRRFVADWLASRGGNYSLCHGLAGNAETLVYGRQVLDSHREADSGLVAEIADRGIDRYHRRDRPWPCGSHGGSTPALMLGLAGIGYFYLRLYDPSVPSLLLLRREAFA